MTAVLIHVKYAVRKLNFHMIYAQSIRQHLTALSITFSVRNAGTEELTLLIWNMVFIQIVIMVYAGKRLL